MNRLFIYFALIFLAYACQSKPEQMIFPENVEIIHQGNPPCPTCESKIVAYLSLSERSLYPFTDNIVNWKEFADSYPDLSVIIFLGGKAKDENNSKEKVISFFRKRDFPYPVYLDPEDTFFKMNHLENVPFDNKSNLFFLVQGNQILDFYEFGIPNLRESQLEQHFRMKPSEISP
ncbi:hypothetical protein E4S40_15240 [Algoriphagus kandeliae]|uniref:Uncharacterized protein n=1 Tax=Algoriphagus kandeliae TaxID=2562278 RepID=A0A4Y9QR97_9BACT|nr:hypothetical protein [Algoriphagus kandeliae]TFV93596.1 hypothetical protein E4S40_15240 [Algoriphagus kandeliae]